MCGMMRDDRYFTMLVIAGAILLVIILAALWLR
jgi:hypothetical protein